MKLVCGPALETERTDLIPASVTVAQAILESAAKVGDRYEWGASSLFRLAHNPFGIKFSHTSAHEAYGEFAAATREFIDGESKIVQAGFQRFPDLRAAFKEHARLFWSPHYAKAVMYRTDWRKFATLLGPKSEANPDGCGYATDPEYGAKLIKLIEDYRLDQRATLQDWTALSRSAGATASAVAGEQ